MAATAAGGGGGGSPARGARRAVRGGAHRVELSAQRLHFRGHRRRRRRRPGGLACARRWWREPGLLALEPLDGLVEDGAAGVDAIECEVRVLVALLLVLVALGDLLALWHRLLAGTADARLPPIGAVQPVPFANAWVDLHQTDLARSAVAVR